MVFKQGKNFDDETGETKESEEIAKDSDEEEGDKLALKKKLVIGGFVLLVLVALIIVVCIGINKKDTVTEEGTGIEDILEGDLDVTSIEDEDAAYWDDFDDGATFSTSNYTQDDISVLRAWGYTGNEIETFSSENIPVENLIQEARKAQEAKQQTLSTPTSQEYRDLLSKTWLGQPKINLPAYNPETTEDNIYYNSYTLNADYEKIPPTGHSLFLKIHMNDGTCVFMECPLARYMQLADAGNIVVNYQTATIGGVQIIYDMHEVEVN